MISKDGLYIKINKAELTHNEPMKTLDVEYIGRTGKWRYVVKDMDINFDKAEGYEVYDTDRHMGYTIYFKEVTTDALSVIKLSVTDEKTFSYDVEMPVPEALKDEIAAFAEKDGNRILSQDIIEKLEKAYTADEIFDEIGKKYGYRRRENL